MEECHARRADPVRRDGSPIHLTHRHQRIDRADRVVDAKAEQRAADEKRTHRQQVERTEVRRLDAFGPDGRGAWLQRQQHAVGLGQRLNEARWWRLRGHQQDARPPASAADSIFACIGIGSETSGGIRNIRIETCKFVGAQTFAVYIKTRVGRGAFIEDVSTTDLEVSGVNGGFLRINALSSGLQEDVPVAGDEGIPMLRNFRFSNVRVLDCPVLVDAVAIHPSRPLDRFTLTGVTGTSRKGIALANMRNVTIRDVNVTGLDGPLLAINNVTGKGLDGATALPPTKLPEPVAPATTPYQLR